MLFLFLLLLLVVFPFIHSNAFIFRVFMCSKISKLPPPNERSHFKIDLDFFLDPARTFT